MPPAHGTPPLSIVMPLVGLALWAATAVPGAEAFGTAVSVVLIPVLFGTVFAAVHHAEVIAARTGEPYGTLVLTMAVTVIEVALIASLMLKPDPNPALARDTVFAVIMIVCNGLVGACILAGGLRYGEIGFRVTGAGAYLAVLAPLAALSLVLPNTTVARAGPAYSTSQLVFVSIVTILLWAAFVYIQTVRHRDHFVGRAPEGKAEAPARPGDRTVLTSAALLLVALAAVILLSKTFAAAVEAGTRRIGAPEAVVGVVVALLILLPESVAALAAARRNELQKSLNLALGSSLATIGLTIPAVAAVAIAFDKPLALGLDPKDTVLLTLTLFVSVVTFGTGRTNILFGFVHLVVFATFVFLVFVP